MLSQVYFAGTNVGVGFGVGAVGFDGAELALWVDVLPGEGVPCEHPVMPTATTSASAASTDAVVDRRDIGAPRGSRQVGVPARPVRSTLGYCGERIPTIS